MTLFDDRKGEQKERQTPTSAWLIAAWLLLALLLLGACLPQDGDADAAVVTPEVVSTQEMIVTPTQLSMEPTRQPTGTPAETSSSRSDVRTFSIDGIWLSRSEIRELPTEGEAWQNLVAAAEEDLSDPELDDKDDRTDVYVLAAALVYVRSGEESYRERVLESLEEVMGSEGDADDTTILAIGRNIPGYVIAADLVGLSEEEELDRRFRQWLQELRDTVFEGSGGDHSIISCHEKRPNNFGTHCGAARAAIALYLEDDADLERTAWVFRGWLGDRSAYTGFEFGRLTWQADPENPVGINPPDVSKEGRSIGGALPEEMRRGNGKFRWPPNRSGYAWEAMQGAIVQAQLLSRAGFPAWSWQDQALLRAAEFLYEIGWEPQGDDLWQVWLINHAYGTSFETTTPTIPGKNMGWTDWTHAEPNHQSSEEESHEG
jgi:hypothetical protein